ncbi:cation diffusion facilitator family transporter [Catenisphaera adipataccumulans]|uniref:Cation diffusion facilitator family transporter n=1 Tax=Catenisphaera adipataccumulans TaxID=700500 RepID=A0A7W8FX71_9FIRM|nr:cation diffusion facilitator family transporter [Catenisphaera adipataccumulans]MBB5183400.1 cation diffusion facilitator family transporter [Catenisphaera adipataccumulans]
MVNFLIRKYVSDYEKTEDPTVRSKIGRLSGIVGIFFNILLFALKFAIGTVVHSVSIQADAINNLTDSGSSFLEIISFHFAQKPADEEHPFGHQRTETIASFLVAIMLGYLGLKMMEESAVKILHPGTIDFRMTSVVILLFSVAVKLYMYFYNRSLARRYSSSLLQATAADSISDVIGTSAVLISTVISPLIHFNLDGYMGAVSSIIILYGAYQLLKEVVDSLLGKAPDPEMVKELKQRIIDHKMILGVHDLIIHDYGPGQIFASAHVEVDADANILKIHDEIDNIERQIHNAMNIELVLHMDPIKVNDPETDLYKDRLAAAIKEIGAPWSFHDFRIINGPTHTNLVFDLVIPFDEPRTKKEIIHTLRQHIDADHPIYLVITLDHPMS